MTQYAYIPKANVIIANDERQTAKRPATTKRTARLHTVAARCSYICSCLQPTPAHARGVLGNQGGPKLCVESRQDVWQSAN